jgi:predicted RNA-binding protein associated with RNAse of E/G family
MSEIIVRKLNAAGEETYRWTGHVLLRTPTSITLEAFFARFDRLDLGYAVLERGDRFVEHFYSDRWYNVFEIHAAGSDALRGWYCNLTRPARFSDSEIVHEDLALDVWVGADGTTQVLDEEEFAALPLSDDERKAARAALAELLALAEQRSGPFSPSRVGRELGEGRNGEQ